MPDTIVEGRRLEYRFSTPAVPGMPTVVFLHEGLGCASAWMEFPERLATQTGCGVMVYSRWGYGRSERRDDTWPATFMHDEARRVVPSLLAAFDIRDAVLFGHSDGGSIALIASALSPGLARGVIVEAAHVMVEDTTVAGIRGARARFEAGDLRAGLARLHGENTDALFGGWSSVWLSPEFRNWDLRPLLPQLTCPVLAIQGLADEYGTRAQADAIATLSGGPVESWLIEDCRHSPHREKPDDVLARAAAFVTNLAV